MPKQVRRDERRRQLAEAVLRITTSRGLDAVSLRDVAAEAGVSLGMVQYYFTSKDEMLLFACQYTNERADQRMQDRLATDAPSRSARSILRTMCVEILPLDAERRAMTHIWIAFLARAVVEPTLAVFMEETWVRAHAFIVEQIRHAQENDEIPADRDPQGEAITLFALVDGLMPHVLIGHYSAEAALRAVDSHLDGLFRATQRD